MIDTSGARPPDVDGGPEVRPPSALAASALVARTDLLRRVRNRSALITAFVGPLAFAVVFALLIGGASSPTFEIGVVDLDASELSTQLTDSLTSDDADGPVDADEADTGASGDGEQERRSTVRFVALDDRAAAETAVDDGDVDAALVVPESFGAAVTAGTPPPLVVLRSPDRTIAGQVAESVATSIRARFALVAAAATAASEEAGAPPTDAVLEAARAADPPLVLADLDVEGDEIEPAAWYGAAMSILFLFFTVGFAARSVIAEQRDGTLARLLAGPTAPGAVIIGKTASVALLGLTGFATVWLVTDLVFGASWGDPAAVAVLVAATVVAVAGVATFVSSLARTPQQAESYTAMVTFALALVGGNFLGPGQLPGILDRLSLLTPNGWALQGFGDAAAGALAASDLARTVAALVAFGVVFGAIGLTRVRRTMTP